MRVSRPNSTLKVDTEKPLRRTELRRAKPPDDVERNSYTADRKPGLHVKGLGRSGFTPASPAQKAKVRDALCVVRGVDRHEATVDAAHLWKRQHGGCDDPLCVVPLSRACHRAFDDGAFDLLPWLRPLGDERRWLPEILHALDHADGDLVGLLRRLTGDRYVPASGGAK